MGFSLKKMVGLHTGRIASPWKYDSKSTLLVPPAVADINNDGKLEIIIGTSKGDLIVLNSNAQEIWRFSINEKVGAVEEMFLDQDVMNSINAPPVLVDITGNGKPNILFGSEMGILYCLDETGKLLWKFKTGGGIRGAPLVVDVNHDHVPEVVFGCTDQYLYLLTSQGKLIERFKQSSPIESTPGFFNGQIVFGTNDGSIISINPTGESNWLYKTKGKVTAAPTFAKLTTDGVDYVIIGSCDNSVYCLDVDGELVWTYETGGAVYSKATVADLDGDGKQETLVGSCDNSVHAITAEGDKFWTYETDFWVVGTPLVADLDGDGNLEVVVGSYDHNIYILDSRGSYLLDYVPGLSGVVQQAGHYSEVMTQEPGEHVGKKIWQFKTDGVVVGCTSLEDQHGFVVATKTGVVNSLIHTG